MSDDAGLSAIKDKVDFMEQNLRRRSRSINEICIANHQVVVRQRQGMAGESQAHKRQAPQHIGREG